jgi:alpha-glucosidase
MLDPSDPITPCLASVHHDGSPRYVVPVAGDTPDHLRIGDEIRLRVRSGVDRDIERVFVRTTPDGEQVFVELQEVQPGPANRWWEVTLRLSMPVTGYRFLLLARDGHRWLNGSGIHRATPTDHEDFRLVAGYDPPGWLANRVFYQVFPDRFANGDPSNDVRDGEWTYRGHAARARAWDDPPSSGPGALVEFFGGDLAGIESHLDYLADLGVNAIYLNPVFATRSNHGYDTVDYEHVADHFGGDAALVSLRLATRARDIRLMLDIAPNHVGSEHPWFLEAQADPDAGTAGHFVFRRRPADYESWLGIGSLPKLDYRDPALREAMYAGPDAILRRWLRPPFSIDGWRIDVANMLGRLGPDQLGAEVARGMRAAVKHENPDAYLMGEHSFDATDQLAGDQWDGVMNYAGFMNPVLEWLHGVDYGSHASGTILQTGRASTASLVETLTAFLAAVPWAVAAHQYNLVASHDTARIRTAVAGDVGHARAGFGLLLTFVGVPSILYGDEIGLEGEDGLQSRRTMPWAQASWDLDHLAFTRSLVHLRVRSRALQVGGLQFLEQADDSLAFLRDTDEEQVVVVVARGPAGRPAGPLSVASAALADGTALVEVLTGARATVEGGHLQLPETRPGVAVWSSVSDRRVLNRGSEG